MPVLFTVTVIGIISIIAIILFGCMPTLGKKLKQWFSWEDDTNKTKDKDRKEEEKENE